MLMSAFFEVKNRICLGFFTNPLKWYTIAHFYIYIFNSPILIMKKLSPQILGIFKNFGNFGTSKKLLLSETMR